MRPHLLALFLLLTACSPPSPPSDQAAPDAPAASSAPPSVNAAALSGAPVAGQWFFHGADTHITAGFGEPESEYVLTISCEMPTHQLSFTAEHELAPDQETTLNLLTASSTIAIPARSFNEGLPNISGALDGEDPRLDALAARQERFATQAAGTIRIYPWDEALARVLDACGVR